MNIFADQNPDCWGAPDFVDDHMQPISKVLEVQSVGFGPPPAGGDKRIYFVAKGDRNGTTVTVKAFFNKTSRNVIATSLGTRLGEEMKGALVKVTAAMVRNRKASPSHPEIPKEILGMMVIAAKHPDGKQQQKKQATAAQAQQAQTAQSNQPSPTEPQPAPQDRGDAYEEPSK